MWNVNEAGKQYQIEKVAELIETLWNVNQSTVIFVSDVLKQHLDEFTSVCACGPKPMLHALADIAEAKGIPCQVSMEERMGCGIGACLVCVCSLKNKDGSTRYGHVCKDGPVFDSKEVQW